MIPFWFYLIPFLFQLFDIYPTTIPNDWFYAQRAFPYDSIPQLEYTSALNQVLELKKSQKRGKSISWKFAGPTNIGGRITDIESPIQNENIIYVGSASGGVFKTTNKGVSWSPIFDNNPTQSIGDMCMDPSNQDIIYVGSGEANGGGGSMAYDGNGVYKSIDGGLSWDHMGLEFSGSIPKIIIHPTKTNTVYLAAMGRLFGKNNQRGVYKSTNGGEKWEQVFFHSDSVGVIDMVMDPLHPDTLYAATWERSRNPAGIDYGGAAGGIYRSYDGGKIWVKLSTDLPFGNDVGRIGLALAPSEPNKIYAFYVDESGDFLAVYRTMNNGESWIKTNGKINTSTFGWWFGKIFVDPKNSSTVYAMGLYGYKSVDNGNTFVNITDNFNEDVHVDQHALYINPNNTQNILLGNDGGLYRSSSAGNSWEKINNLPITQFYTCHIDNTLPERIYGGTQDNSSMRTFGNTDTWNIISGGDGFVCEVDPLDNKYVYTESQYGGFVRSTDGGETFFSSTNGFLGSDRFNWKTPFVLHPQSSNILFLGSNRLYKSVNRAVDWTRISPPLTPENNTRAYGTITTISVSPIDPQIIYCGTDIGLAWITSNGGLDWNMINNGLPTRWITSMAADPKHKNKVYITLSGFRYNESIPHVMMSVDNGKNWKDISRGLPPLPVNKILVDPETSGHIIIGTDAGVWRSYNDGSNWQLLGNDMPVSIITDLHFHRTTRKLAAATYGRGIYTYTLETTVSTENEFITEIELTAFPNPTTDLINVQFKSKARGVHKLNVIDLSGKSYLEKKILATNAPTNASIDLRNFANGIYLLSLSSSEGIHGSIRIIKN